MKLSADIQSAFDTDGVVHIRGALRAKEVTKLRRAVGRQVANVGNSTTGYDFEKIAHAIWSDEAEIDTGNAARFNLDNLRRIIRSDPGSQPLIEGSAHLKADELGSFIYDSAAWRHDQGVETVALDSRLPEICAKLLGAKYLNFWEDTTFVKMPGTRQKTAFHQDLGYFQIEGDQCVIVWLPLDEADQSNGVTEYVRGSHRWPETFASNSFIAQAPLPNSEGPRLPDIEGQREKFDIVSFTVKPGDAVICHVRTVHGSGGNLSTRPRRAMSFRYCGDQVRYLNKSGALSQSAGPGELSNGDRLFSEDYPVAWPKALRSIPVQDLEAAAIQFGILEGIE